MEEYVGSPQPPARGGGAGAAGQAAAAGRAATAAAELQLPVNPLRLGGVPAPGGARAGGAGGGGRAAQTPEQLAAAHTQADELSKWRASVPMSKFAEVKRKFDTAGVHIYAYRLTLTNDMPDSDYDYTFNAAKALGATQITMEHPTDPKIRSVLATSR